MYEDQPQYKVLDLFENLLYPNHPLGYDIVGKNRL
jgi:predicted Zn-dependent peptidase